VACIFFDDRFFDLGINFFSGIGSLFLFPSQRMFVKSVLVTGAMSSQIQIKAYVV
jgi:hypothetical protein